MSSPQLDLNVVFSAMALLSTAVSCYSLYLQSQIKNSMLELKLWSIEQFEPKK